MVDLHWRISQNFSLAEMLSSDVAARLPDLYATMMAPSREVVVSLNNLVLRVLQPARSELGCPLRISSGYRSPELNRYVGGSDTSQHVKGEATDVKVPDALLRSNEVLPQIFRTHLQKRTIETTGQTLRQDINANFLLFAYLSLNLERLNIDQLIHEYGVGPGRPGWVHVSTRLGAAGRGSILAISSNGTQEIRSPKEALRLGC